MAGTTGLEPATSAVTGQRSNQLNYVPTPLNKTNLRTFSRVGKCCKFWFRTESVSNRDRDRTGQASFENLPNLPRFSGLESIS
jgi:hypothetical protein